MAWNFAVDVINAARGILGKEVAPVTAVTTEAKMAQVMVDSTEMEKTIAHSTDARLYETAWRKRVGLAREAGIGH